MLAVYSFLFVLGFAISLTVAQKVLKWPFFEALGAGLLSAAILATFGIFLLMAC